jgi:cysteinyl-tRNA synthetase
MAKKYLGDTIDFHCGGKDLSFPHHENEIAQSEAASGKPFARYWLHNGYININGAKMAKSSGEMFTARDIGEKYGYMPIRFFLLASTFRTPVNFSEEIIKSAQNALDRIFTFGENINFLLKNAELAEGDETEPTDMSHYREKLTDALCDDFNTADAIAVLFDFIRDANTLALGANAKPSRRLLETIKALYDEFCGLFGFAPETKASDVSDAYINEQIGLRAAATKSRDYAAADKIRDELKAMGINLEDTPSGTKWRRA